MIHRKGGFLLVVEGLDGAGKSTVLGSLSEFCKGRGLPCVQSREPTSGVWGKKIRASAALGRMSLQEELDYFIRDRREHVEGLILPSLESGAVVILDRYYLSTAAYQGARGADPEWILSQNEEFAPAPDLALLLDCTPEVSLERIRKRGDVPDAFERLEGLRAVREVFLGIRRPWLRRVDAGRPSEEVAAECLALFGEALSGLGPRG